MLCLSSLTGGLSGAFGWPVSAWGYCGLWLCEDCARLGQAHVLCQTRRGWNVGFAVLAGWMLFVTCRNLQFGLLWRLRSCLPLSSVTQFLGQSSGFVGGGGEGLPGGLPTFSEAREALATLPQNSFWTSFPSHCSRRSPRRWPSATAVGWLAPGKDPRLVLDSTVWQVNPNCSLLKAVQLPTVSAVCFSFQPSDPHSMWMGASLDLKAAHKQVKVREQDQGLLLFEFAGKLYHALRIAHQLLAQQPHKAWLYVDDLLAALLRSSGDLQLALLVVLFVCLKSPISCKKSSPG